MIDKAQLLQSHSNTSQISGSGNLYVDQNSEVESLYLYSYLSSPVVTSGSSSYSVASVMKDGTTPTSSTSIPPDISFISGLDGNFIGSPIEIANLWIYTFDDVGGGTFAYDNNGGIGSAKTIDPGKGYLFKGPGRAQNYTFVGSPNDGTYTYAGIPAGVNILVGNPYPSAFNIQEFFADNASLGTTAYLWQQADVSNAEEVFGYFSSGYNGDYAIINTSTSTQATVPTEIDYILEAEEATLFGSATIVSDKVELTTAFDEISFNFIGLAKSVTDLSITYSSNSIKTIDIDINGTSELTGVSLPSTLGVLTTIEIPLVISPEDVVLLKSNDTNTILIDKVFGRQEYTFSAPPFNHLAIGQGFFFYTDNTGALEFNNSQRAFVPEGTGGSFFFKTDKKINKDLSVLKLGLDFSPTLNQFFHKQIAITFKQGNSFKYDRGFDSPMHSIQNTDMYWKFPEDEAFYGIAGVQEITEDLKIPLEIVLENPQTISINIDEFQNLSKDIYLLDSKENIYYQLSKEKANISLESGLHQNRFSIVFKETVLNLEENVLLDLFDIFHNREAKELLIKNTNNTNLKKIVVYNLLGQKLLEVEKELLLNKKEIIINTAFLKNAIYILNLETEKGTISKNFF